MQRLNDDDGDAAKPEDSSGKYNSRVARARASNQKRKEKAKMISFGPHDFEMSESSMSTPYSPNFPEGGASPFAAPIVATPATPATPVPVEAVTGAMAGAAIEAEIAPAGPAAVVHSTLLQPSMEQGVKWDWSNAVQLLATTDSTNVLRVLNGEGRLIYRVQLPPEGKTVLLGWEPSGAVLAVVQKLGGAFLWFPSKPESVQQWEGMQFTSQFMRKGVLQRNTHFDTDFASWSEAGKLVLGLSDGNFACWDLASNETFMSRKHFAGKLKNGITCGAWGARGEVLAVGSSNQLKVSKPMASASWENTAAKLYNPHKELQFQQLAFAPDGGLLAALAGTSVFAHLCVYEVRPDGKKGTQVVAVGEMHPDFVLGAIQAFIWLNSDVLAVVTRSGHCRLLQRDDAGLIEEQHVASKAEGVVAALLVKSRGLVASVTKSGHVSFFSPADRTIVSGSQLPPAAGDAVPKSLQAAENSLLVGLSDGSVLRVVLPQQTPIDLSGLQVHPVEDGAEGAAGAGTRVRLTGVTPFFVMRVPPEEAPTSQERPLRFAYSTSERLLAVVAAGKLSVRRAASGDLAEEEVLSVQLPDGACIDAGWEPGMEAQLAVVISGNGAVLWKASAAEGGGAESVQMWSGMSYKHKLNKFSSSHKEFDPAVMQWSAAGQLVLGMADGTFAVWDSLTADTFASQKSGKHGSAIKAAAWLPSLFAPALALASTSTIKVSQGFDSVEWAATAMKLKVRADGTPMLKRESSIGRAKQNAMSAAATAKSAAMSAARPLSAVRRSSSGSSRSPAPRDSGAFDEDTSSSLAAASQRPGRGSLEPGRKTIEGLEFTELSFSASGKYLAALAHSTGSPEDRQVIIYELHDQRSALVPVRTISASPQDGQPVGLCWQPDDGLLIFLKTYGGGGALSIHPTRRRDEQRWPPPGVEAPGVLVDAVATTRGLLALAFLPKGAGGGVISLLSPSPLQLLCELPLQHPPASIKLRGAPDGEHFLSVGFEQGGVEVWSLTPEDDE